MSTNTSVRPTASEAVLAAEHPRHVDVIVVGSGFSGIGLAHKLREAGFDDLVILERSTDPGGVWHLNTFPGATCDVPSHLYSFSFAPNPEWSSTYSPQPEIRAYLHDLIDRFGLRDVLRTGVEVTGAEWHDEEQRWVLDTSEGRWTARVLVSAVGPLTEPKLPDVPGIGTFAGEVMHSARWDSSYDLTGKRVASIGTGASAIQYVPRIADAVGQLFVFQRTAPWIMPHDKRPISEEERARFRRHPALQRLARARVYLSKEVLVLPFAKRPGIMKLVEKASTAHMESQVADPGMRRMLAPSYTLGCKRILPSNEWYPALQKPNVTLVPNALREVREHSVIDSEGVEREVDAIIFGTGFQVTEIPFADRVRGRDGRLLNDVWGGTPRAYLGASVPGFPNYFMMLGPNTGLGHSSMIYMIEAQIDHVVRAVQELETTGATSLEVSRGAFDAYNRNVDQKLLGTVWEIGGCTAFYRDATGRNSTIWPDWTFRFRRIARSWKPGTYVLRAVRRRATPPAQQTAQQVTAR